MVYLTRPRTLGGTMFDNLEFDGGGGGGNLPANPNGTIDWSKIALPDFTAPLAPTQAGSPLDFNAITRQIVTGAQNFYSAKNAVDSANYGNQLAKAQAQAAINIAKAGGQAATRTAGAGAPSPTLLLIAGLGLAAVVLLKR